MGRQTSVGPLKKAYRGGDPHSSQEIPAFAESDLVFCIRNIWNDEPFVGKCKNVSGVIRSIDVPKLSSS